MPRPTSLVFLALLVTGLALVVGWASLGDHDEDEPRFGVGAYGQQLSMSDVELRGRLLDASNGRTLTDVGVLAIHFERQAGDPALLVSFAWRTAAARGARTDGPTRDEEGRESAPSGGASHTLTDAEGRFRVRFLDTDGRGGADGKPVDPTSRADRQRLHGLLIERRGAAPWVLAPPPRGTWRPRSPFVSDGPLAVWDLGDVLVPPAPPR